MAEWFVGPVMEKLIEACSEYFKDQFKWQKGMQEELQRLRDIHPTIQYVVSSYSQLQIENPHLNKWLWKLRDAVDEVDDVLDEIEYLKHEKQVSKNKKTRKVRFHLKSMKKRIVKFGKRALKIDPTLKRLEEAVQKLDKISTEVSTFQTFLESRRQEQQKQQEQQQQKMRKSREMGAMPTDNLLGRSKEMEFLRKWLSNLDQTEITNSEDLYRNVSLKSVVGHGGMGKTTLLQHVYEDGVTKKFGVKAWVCVSENFDAKKVITDILESIKKERPSLETLDALQKSLKSEVESKTFLLVLDDIWEDDEEEWKKVLAPLSHGSLGRKILITTRMDEVALMFAKIIRNSKEPLQLKGLEEDQCLQLLNKHAFAARENPDDYIRLKFITEEMVKKLSGSPLAAKVIGGILSFNLNESFWRKVLNTDIHNVNPGQNILLPILKLSYIYLPKHLQNCFGFCGIFPQDHKFDKEDLVRMWIALGFIQPQNSQGETLEEIGENYFDILFRKSFFDEFYWYDRAYYKMHDILHELAQFVSPEECFRVVDDKKLSIPETVRHLSIQTSSLKATVKKMGEFKNLRSLFLSVSKHDENFMSMLTKIFKATKNIRLLFICDLGIQRIPDTINCLIHLRYLRLDDSNFTIPRSICHLYHLQFIIYNRLPYLNDHLLPRNINNLYNLRYVRLPSDEYSMIYGIGMLKSLQKFDHFYVKNEIGYRIGELEHMNELRQINIHQLQNINDAEEVCCAKFCDKKNLTNLTLQWGEKRNYRENIVDHDLDEKVLDRIQPYNNLKRLCIYAYMGVRSAMWMNDVYLTSSNLEYIKLDKCLKWKTLPPFGQLPFLKSLYLCNMPEVEKLDHNKDCKFSSLEMLHIEKLKALQEWFDPTLAAENGCLLPRLTKLFLENCPNLQELPSLPTELQELDMRGIGWKACNLLQGIRNCSRIYIQNSLNISYLIGRQQLMTNENCHLIIDRVVINDPSVLLREPLRSVSSLHSLKIERNDEFVSFPIETEQCFLQLCSSLSQLKIFMLQSLESLPSSFESLSLLNILYVSNVPRLKLLPKLPYSLETLELRTVESLQCLPDLPSSLKVLYIMEMKSLQRLPSSLSAISSLTDLQLINIPLLKSLPDLPSSLETLHLQELHSLQRLPSLSANSSLAYLALENIPLLKSLPDLPSSLSCLYLKELENLDCLLFCLPTLKELDIIKVPRLLELPDLPASLWHLSIRDCHLQLMKRYEDFKRLKNMS